MSLTTAQKMGASEAAADDPVIAALVDRYPNWVFGLDDNAAYAQFELAGVRKLGGATMRLVISGPELAALEGPVSMATTEMIRWGITGQQGAR